MAGFDPKFDPAGPSSARDGSVPAPGNIDGPSHYLAADRTWRAPGSVPPGPPPPAPGPALNQWACNLAGFLTYEVVRALTKKAIDWLPVSFIADVVGGTVTGLLDLLLPGTFFIDEGINVIVFHYVSDYINAHLADFAANIIDDVLWAKIHCQLYDAVVALPGDLATALDTAATAIAALTGYPSGVLLGIEYLLENMGITSVVGMPLTAFARQYDCSTCATTGIGPTKPVLQTSFDLTVEDAIGDATTFVDTLELVGTTVTASGSKATATPKLTTANSVGVNQPDNATLGVNGTGVYAVLNGQLATINLDQIGSVAATASGGTTISSLIVGQTYALQSTGGPWDPFGTGIHHSFGWDASVDAGATWQHVFSLTDTSSAVLFTPPWALSVAQTDSNHARVVWVATVTTVLFRVGDTVYGDNTGSLGWQLLDVVFEGSSLLIEHSGSKVATRPSLDFEDTGNITWTVTDDPTNDRVKVSGSAPGGTVTGVTAAAPITSSGGAAPTIGLSTPLAQQYGGTGIDSSAAADGQLLIGQTSDHSLGLATLSGGTGIAITNSGHGISIAASGSGGGGTALTKIAQAAVVGPVTNIPFSGISGAFSELWIVLVGRGDAVATNVFVAVQFNGDTAANYDSQYFFGQGGSSGGGEELSTATPFAGIITAASAVAGRPSIMRVRIPLYAGTAWQKLWTWDVFESRSDSTGDQANLWGGGVWKSTATITSIKLFPTSGDFVANTVATLYGVS